MSVTQRDNETDTEFYLRESIWSALLGTCRRIMNPYTEAEDTPYEETIKEMSTQGKSIRQSVEWSLLETNYNRLLDRNLSTGELLLMAEDLRVLTSNTKVLGPINKRFLKKMSLE